MDLRSPRSRALTFALGLAQLAPLAHTNPLPAPLQSGTPCQEVDRRSPGSLLLYPEFDNRNGNLTLLTLTNEDCDARTGAIDVEFVYVGRYGLDGADLGCLEFNRTRHLSPCDTISLFTNAENPGQTLGYVYAFAKSASTGEAVVFNHLIGQVLYMGFDNVDDSVNAVSFQGIGAQGTPTDHNGDQLRQLNGVEYSPAPDEILIPRFLGQDPGVPAVPLGGPPPALFRSRLILIALSGGTGFDTSVNLEIFNDNEELFSGQYTFRCWATPTLAEISNAFTQTFLASTNQNQGEIVGATSRESGWLRLRGDVAYSTSSQIFDPAVYAVLVERVGPFAVIDLPFELCSQVNGVLLAQGSALPGRNLNTLYGTQFSGDELATLDVATGAGTQFGPSGVGTLRGLAFDPNTNTLYATSQSGSALRMDRTTGQATVIGLLGPAGGSVFGLTFDSNTNTLYGISPGGTFSRVDTSTGVATLIGNTGFAGMRGIAFDPNTNTLYGASYFAGKLLTIDTNTAAATIIGDLPVAAGGVTGLAFQPATNALYGVMLSGTLLRIDTATAASTVIGRAGFDMNNIAFGR